MKKSVLAMAMVAVFALVMTLGFSSCKKQEPPADVPKLSDVPAPDAAAKPDEAKEEKKEEKK